MATLWILSFLDWWKINKMRNPNLPPKPKYEKIDRVEQKRERMDKMMNVIDRVGKINDSPLQEVCGFGDGVFYNIRKAVLQTYPQKYQRSKGVWEGNSEYLKAIEQTKEDLITESKEITTQPIEITTEWESNKLQITVWQEPNAEGSATDQTTIYAEPIQDIKPYRWITIPELIPEPTPELIPELIPEPTPEPIPELAEPKSPQESEKSSNDEPIIISDEEKSDNNQIIWVFVIISFIIMGFAILKKKVQHQKGD